MSEKKGNLKYWIYAGAVLLLVLAVWLATKDGMQPNEWAIPADDIGWVGIYSSSMDKRVEVTGEASVRELTNTLNKLVPENGIEMEEDEIQLGKEFYKLEWYGNRGELLAEVDISQTGRVYREEYCFNYIGGEVFDMDKVAELLFGLPEA